MICKIAFVLKPSILKYCRENLTEIPSETQVDFFSYSDKKEFEDVCKNICKAYDGIITSGYLPDSVLEHAGYARSTFHEHFHFDLEYAYHLILRELLEQKGLRISEIGIDFLYRTEKNLEELILSNQVSWAIQVIEEEFKKVVSYDAMELWEKGLEAYYEKLLEARKIRCVLTSSFAVSENLTAKGYHCKYILPSLNTIKQVIKTLCYKIEMQNMRGIMPAMIRVDLHPPKDAESTYSLIQYNEGLKKKLMEFIQLEGRNLNLRCNTNSFEIYSDLDTIQNLTKNYTHCCLMKYISQPLEEMISIGYGLGDTFYQAHVRAMTASDYGFQSKKELGSSFLIDEKEQLIALKSDVQETANETICIANENLKQISLEAKLSVSTLMKIMNVLKMEQTEEISSVELMNHLRVSLRTANHYLSNLEKCGRASVVAQRRPNGRGRSINVYHLEFL